MFTIRSSCAVTKALEESIGRGIREGELAAAVAEIPELNAAGVVAAPSRDDLVLLAATPRGHWKWEVLLSALSATIADSVVALDDALPERLSAYFYWRAADYAAPETRNAALCLLDAHDKASGTGLIRAAARAFQRDAAATKDEEGILDDDQDDDGDAMTWVSEDSGEEDDDDEPAEDDEDQDGRYESASADEHAESANESMQLVPRPDPVNSVISTSQLERIAGYDGPNVRAALALANSIQSLEAECKSNARSGRASALVTALAAIPETEAKLALDEAETAARAFAAALGTRPGAESLVGALTAALAHNADELADMVVGAVVDARDECATAAAMLDPTQAPLNEQEAIERRAHQYMLAQIAKLEAQIDAHERATNLTPTGALSDALKELRTRRAALARQQAHTAATIDRLVAAQRPTITTSAEVLGVTSQWAESLAVVSLESLASIEKVVNAAWRKAVKPVHADKMQQADAEAKAKAEATYSRLDAAKDALLARIAEIHATLAGESEADAPLRARAAKRKARELELERELLDARE